MTRPIGSRVARQAMLCCGMIVSGLGWSDSAEAQNVRRNYSAGAQAGGNGGGQQPFQNAYRRPAVSPYTQMTQQGFNPLQSQTIYQQMVVPQLQQQQQQIEQLSQNRQINRLQNQVQQIQRDTTGRQVDESIRPTGHRATYMNYSHYYQQ
jgi:hypothetical protein